MKKIIILLAISSLLLLSGCQTKKAQPNNPTLPEGLQSYNTKLSQDESKAEPVKLTKEDIDSEKVNKANFAIDGMTCSSCALGIEYQWKQLDGVYDSKVDYSAGTGFAIYDNTKLTAQEIADASTAYVAKVDSDKLYTK